MDKSPELLQQQLDEAVDKIDLLEKKIEELANIILQYRTVLPAEYISLAQQYINSLTRNNC